MVTKKEKEKKYYAYFEHETVQAMLHSLFRFQNPMQAQLVSNRFADEVILSPKMSDPKDRKAIVLWVRDLDVTEEQRKLGYLGNYGKISLVKLPNGKWTLSMIRIDVPLGKHPLYVKVARRYPNSGHPVLRNAARNKTWPSMQEAFEQLMKLHEEYPEVSIPGVNKLKIMSYKKAEKGKSPVERLELSVVKRDEGAYGINIKNLSMNVREAVAKDLADKAGKSAPAAKKAEPKKTEGKYTAMVTKTRKKKK
jgi:hypothetical protein